MRSTLKQIYESMILESMGHTLWIDDRGRIIDISKTGITHFDWAWKNRSKFKTAKPDDNAPYVFSFNSGWVQVRNGSNISFHGVDTALHSNRKTMSKIVEQRMFDPDGHYDPEFWIEVNIYDINDAAYLKREMYHMPEDDNKFRRKYS